MKRWSIRLLSLFLLVLPQSGTAAASFQAEYSVSVRGLPVGRAVLAATRDGDGYDVTFSGEVGGLLRLFSDGAADASASGQAQDGGLAPAEYTHLWTEDDEEERVSMRFDAGGVTELSAEPPRRRPERYLPVTEAHKQGVLDPVSALIWPAGDQLAPEACQRALPVFDGRNRFDLALSFDRMEQFAAKDGSYAGPALVCAIRYVPIAGHRPERDSVRFMAANEDIEVWMAPAGDTGLLAPAAIRVRTKVGRLVLEAQRFTTE